MKSFLARAALALALVFTVSACDQKHSQQNEQTQAQTQSQQDETTTRFATADDAQKHCPSDTVVWVNTATGVYHMPGQRWYGNTAQGDYMCQQDADKEGDRETRNGQ